MHATEFLSQPDKPVLGPLVVLHGDEAFLKRNALSLLTRRVLGAGQDNALGLTRLAGKETDLKTVRDDLLTVSMFGDRRLVLVEDADDFVSEYRAGLENYLDRPARKSLLVLEVKTWRKNTRLTRKVAEVGLELECTELTGARLAGWLVEQARGRFEKQLTRDAASLMAELAGSSLGLLDQELAKLAAYVGDRGRIGAEDVRALVGGWKAETTWTMTAALRDGQPGVALHCLDKLLMAGEAPQRILGGITFVFRKLARATEQAREGTPLRVALKEAGVFPSEIDSAERYLRRIGRPRAESLLAQLLAADSDLKGGSRVADRLQMEQLLLHICGTLPQ